MALITIFAQRLTDMMKVRDISTTQMADLLYVSHNTVSGYRSGRRRPNIDQLVLISNALSVSADYLLGLSDKIDIQR